MRLGFLLAATLAAGMVLAGCVTSGDPQVMVGGPAPGVFTKLELTPADVKTIEAGVRKSLKDPNSAMFDGVFATINDKEIIHVCGYVNAKNSFGGYVGKQPYMGVLERKSGVFAVAGMGGTEAATYAVRQICQRHGLNV